MNKRSGISKEQSSLIIRPILQHFPNAQAIYLFGSHGTEYEMPESDVDIALLLPHAEAKQAGSLAMHDLHFALEELLGREVDLINLRQVNTVFQIEIIYAERRIFTADLYAAEEFEMLALSFYQKLNEERAGIISDAMSGGRFYNL